MPENIPEQRAKNQLRIMQLRHIARGGVAQGSGIENIGDLISDAAADQDHEGDESRCSYFLKETPQNTDKRDCQRIPKQHAFCR